MPEEFTPRQYPDKDGLLGQGEIPDDIGPCLLCGRDCRPRVDGLRIHVSCWELSTAAEREEALVHGPRQQPAPSPQEPARSKADTTKRLPEQASDATAGTATQPAASNARVRTPKAKAAATPRGSGGRFRAAAAVVDVDGVWLPDGTHYDLPFEVRNFAHLAYLGEKLNLGTEVLEYKARDGRRQILTQEGQVWVGHRLLERSGVDVDAIVQVKAGPKRTDATLDATTDTDFVRDGLAAGYTIGGNGGDRLGPWTRVWPESGAIIWLALIPALGENDVPLLAGDPDNAHLARRIGLMAEHLRYPYKLSSSTTGLDLAKTLRGNRREWWETFSPVEPEEEANLERDFDWSREPTDEEKAHRYVHAYDRSGSYLAGAMTELGVGAPEHHQDGHPFDPKLFGYWRIRIPEPGDWRIPNPLDPSGTKAGDEEWVTTETLSFVTDGLPGGVEVLEAYVWPSKARVLEPWYERIRDARMSLDLHDPDAHAAREQVKRVYTDTLGMMGSETYMEGRDGYKPAWRHAIIAKARSNILRRVAAIGNTTGRWPVAILADTVLYTSDEPDPVQAWPDRDEKTGEPKNYGRRLGQYKHEGTALLADHLEYLTGGRYRGKRALSTEVSDA